VGKTGYKGIVKGRTVVLEEAADLPEGTEVLVTPMVPPKGSPKAVLAAIDAPPYIKPEDVDELIRLIVKGKRLRRFYNLSD
jgi:hypothetical protein